MTGLELFDPHLIHPGLESTRELFARAGNPERKLRFLHLAGTNGKGSVGAMLESALRACGVRTGFYTSPHLIEARERFRIDGRAVDEALYHECSDELTRLAAGGKYSYFEFATVLAALIFVRAGVEMAVWETGMGGRLDSTNLVMPQCSVITNIALDHQRYLGDTLELIAAEKGGIIKPGAAVFAGIMPPEPLEVLRGIAAGRGAPFFAVPEEETAELRYDLTLPDRIVQSFVWRGRRIVLPLGGPMQRRNFFLAFAVLEYLSGLNIVDMERALAGIAQCRWPGRCDRVRQNLVIDGGHNPDGVAALCASLEEIWPGEKFNIIFGGFKDKDAASSIAMLSALARRFAFVPLHEEGRANYSAAELRKMAEAAGFAGDCREAVSAVAAAEEFLKRGDEYTVAVGSLYSGGELLERFCGRDRILDLV